MKNFVLLFMCIVFLFSFINGFFIFKTEHYSFNKVFGEVLEQDGSLENTLEDEQESLRNGNSEIETQKVENEIEIQHFFTHELIYDANKAFSTKNSLKNSFDRDHITCEEFKNILASLYENNFILVDIFDVYDEIDGKLVAKKDLDFNGKKPFILSFDDMTYDTKGRGIVEKLIVVDGEIYDYASVEDKKFSKERDCITILEGFIKENPDFSYNGARATLCVTGYNGAFGHRVFSDTYLTGNELEKEKENLITLIALLKEKGYKFASHSYGHINSVFSSYETICKDVEKWKSEIGQYVGETQIYCYPGGAHKCGTSNNEFLKSSGFNIFLCTGNKLTQGEKQDSATYLYRHPLDGKSLRNCEKEYANFFSVEEIYDKNRYVSFEYKEGY